MDFVWLLRLFFLHAETFYHLVSFRQQILYAEEKEHIPSMVGLHILDTHTHIPDCTSKAGGQKRP